MWVRVVCYVMDLNRPRQLLDALGPIGFLISSRSYDNLSRPDFTVGSAEEETPFWARLKRVHLYALAHRCLKRLGVGFHVANEVISLHEAVRLRTSVGLTGQSDGPTRQDKAEALPAASPTLSNLSSLENDVLPLPAGKFVAQGQTRLPRTDYHDVMNFGHFPL